jgi:translation initiation factor 2A
VAIAGFMPAKVVLFSSRCKKLADLSSGSFNTIGWDPFGNFFFVAGFGNLPGRYSARCMNALIVTQV